MLRFLRIRHLAVIDAAEVEFGPGFNVLTGGPMPSTELRMATGMDGAAGSARFSRVLTELGRGLVVTGYGGLTLTQGSTAGVICAALNTDLGAIGLDITHASTQLESQPNRNGQSAPQSRPRSADSREASSRSATPPDSRDGGIAWPRTGH